MTYNKIHTHSTRQSKKVHWLVVFCVCIISTAAAQTVDTDELNQNLDGLLELFYTGSLTGELTNIRTTEPVYPTLQKDYLGFTDSIDTQIAAEEQELQKLNDSLRALRIQGSEQSSARAQILDQVSGLEEEIWLITEKLELLQDQAQQWQSVITGLTTQRSQLHSLYRATKRDKERLVLESLLATNSLQGRSNISWIFTNESLGDMLEEKRLRTLTDQAHEAKLQMISAAHEDIAQREQNAAKILARMENMAQQVAQEQAHLSSLITAKAALTQQLNQSNDALHEEQEAFYKAQQAVQDRILELQDEREFRTQIIALALQNNESNTTTEEERTTFDPEPEQALHPVFVFPLQQRTEVTAMFQDPQYETAFNQEHIGVDFYAPQGSAVLSIADGVVEEIIDGGLGYSYVIVSHEYNFYSVYGHISSAVVEVGESVSAGQQIAKSGGTPGTRGAGFFTTGPHIHLELWTDGIAVDPLQYLP